MELAVTGMGLFVGPLCYADDLILLAPCPSAKTQLICFGSSPYDKCTTAIYFVVNFSSVPQFCLSSRSHSALQSLRQ